MVKDANLTKSSAETCPETYHVQDQLMEIPIYQAIQVDDQLTVTEPELEEQEQEHGPGTHTNQDLEEHLQTYEDLTDKPTDPKDRIEDALHHQHNIDQTELHQELLMHTM